MAKETIQAPSIKNMTDTALDSKEREWQIAKIRYSQVYKQVASYANESDQDAESPPPHEHTDPSTLHLGLKLAQKLNTQMMKEDPSQLGPIALLFVEQTWLQHALNQCPMQETVTTIIEFLDACDPTIQEYCEETPQGQTLTRLQEIRQSVMPLLR